MTQQQEPMARSPGGPQTKIGQGKDRAKVDLSKLRSGSKTFCMNTVSTLQNLQLRHSALLQKLHSTETYNLSLHRQNNVLRDKIKILEHQLATGDLDLDSSMFDDDMSESTNNNLEDITYKKDNSKEHDKIQEFKYFV
jgi:hypothetical protein